MKKIMMLAIMAITMGMSANAQVQFSKFKFYVADIMAHPTNPVEGCADANPKTELPNDT